jgi:secreted trypsin-like serine protease
MGRRKILSAAVAAVLTATGLAGVVWLAPTANAIVGGKDAEQPYPWMVNLSYGPTDSWHLCGASMITDRWAVTAAHCVKDLPIDDPLARVGSNDRTSGGHTRRLTQMIMHPGYKPPAEEETGEPVNDIALIELSAPVEMAPVRIAHAVPAPGTPTRLLGWGMTCREETPPCAKSPVLLKELDTQVNAPGVCRPNSVHAATELCVGDPTGETGGCYGDSGGPQLVAADYGQWELAGLTSREGGTTVSCNMGVYTSVTAYARWIDDTVAGRAPR